MLDAHSSPVLFKGNEKVGYRAPLLLWQDGTFHMFFTIGERESNAVYLYLAESTSPHFSALRSVPWLFQVPPAVSEFQHFRSGLKKPLPDPIPPENPVSYQPPPQNRVLAVTERNRVAPARRSCMPESGSCREASYTSSLHWCFFKPVFQSDAEGRVWCHWWRVRASGSDPG